ncbi:response regulator transcription factor [Pseudonocardia sp. GCM10023141]|uniref:response regulator transcription factor n=1 Tax=Pseudonocardia sp. GCM10023141 TaxID=3252653 RepID=UPI00361A8342
MIIADDHPAFVEGLRFWLTEIGIDVVGAARNADELIALVRADPPDVAITDISMPPGFDDEGLRAAETLTAVQPDVAVLVLSAYREPEWATRLLHRRPSRVGYLLKHNVTDAARLGEALERITQGGVAIDPEIVADLVARRSVTAALESLTDREQLVLTHAAQGRSNRGIATVLGIAERTVENHITRLFQKLDLPDGNQRVLAILEWQKAQGQRAHGSR